MSDSLFIDYLKFSIDIVHEKIEAGRVISINQDETMEWVTEKYWQPEGSYMPNVLIRSDVASDTRFNGSVWCHRLDIQGNMFKWLYGHNVTGNCDWLELIEKVLQRLVAIGAIRIPCYAHLAKALRSVKSGDFPVYRIDLTKMLMFSNESNMRDYMSMLRDVSSTRNSPVNIIEGTIYHNWKSKYWKCRHYIKADEIKRKSKKHRLSDKLTGKQREFLTESCKNAVRKEFEIKARYLKELVLKEDESLGYFRNEKDDVLRLDNISYAQIRDLLGFEAIYKTLEGKIQMSENYDSSENNAIEKLTKAELSTYFYWKQGKNPKHNLKKPTYYRHRSSILKKLGFDIKYLSKAVERHQLKSVRTIEICELDQSIINQAYNNLPTKLPVLDLQEVA